jgi:hypothetical protein
MIEERTTDVFVVAVEGEYGIFYFEGRRSRARLDSDQLAAVARGRPEGYDQGIRVTVERSAIEPADLP